MGPILDKPVDNPDVVTDWSRIRGMVTPMRGSVTKRGSSWSFVVDRGIEPTTGRRRQQRRSGFRTRKEAEEALRRTISSLTDGTFVERTDETIDEYFTRWLEGLTASRRVKPKTVKTYTECLARLRPELGPVRLQALKVISDRLASIRIIPLARIDYIWASEAWLPLESWVGDDAGSDHLPVMARLALIA